MGSLEIDELWPGQLRCSCDWMRVLGAAFALFLVEPVVRPTDAPLPPREARPLRHPSPTWTRQTTTVTAAGVRLGALGMRTHANWVFFRLPFDASDTGRLRHVVFEPHADVETAVGALRLGGVCVAMPPAGGVTQWARYTASGVGGTERFAWHGAVPTDDPTLLGINVPTRVANQIACGRSQALRLLETWTLTVTWEER